MRCSGETGTSSLVPDILYRTVFENTGTAMCIIEEDDIISLCNEEFARLTGLPREEIEGRKEWSEFVAPADLPRMLRYREARLSQSSAAPRQYEFRLVDRQSKTRNIWLTVTRIPETKRTLASLIDITELKQKEEALRLAEADYRAIFEAANDAIFVHDPETGQILDVNPKMTEMYGYTADEARRLTVGDLSAGAPPYTQQEALAWIRKATAGEPQLFEWLARDREGRPFWVEVNLKRATIGDTERLLAVVRDITRRKEAGARLAEEQERYRVTRASIGDAVICTDRTGHITFMNPVAEELTGWPADEAMRRPLSSVFRIESELTGRPAENPVERVLREGVVVGLGNHTVLIARDGKRIPIADSGAPIRDREGNVLGVVLVFCDETERRRVQRERQEAKRRLERILEGGIRAIARLVELRDPYTAGHQQRVAELACAIGRAMGLPESTVNTLHFAGYLHDIGKATIPAAILNKPGPLTPVEMELVKLHPATAHDVLKDVDFGGPVAAVVRQHHERLDGSGYPDGLKGDAILLEARILAVADVVDAMTSHRPYRPAHTLDATLGEIERGRGTRFDASVVDACLRVLGGGARATPGEDTP
ncbi:MAG: PAS domain S-box protein [Bryobacteraceae bacterium]